MLALWGPLLAALAIAQTTSPLDEGEVVDDQGKPVAGARVVLYAPFLPSGEEVSAEVEGRTDAAGRFRGPWPKFRRLGADGITYQVHSPGLAIAAQEIFVRPHRLVLHKPQARTVRVVGPDNRPIAGARIVPRLLYTSDGAIADMPASLAETLAVTTGADGQALIGYVAPTDKLAAVRVTAGPIGAQDILLLEKPRMDPFGPIVTIKVNGTARFSGRVVDENMRPLAGQTIEVWSRHAPYWLPPDQVGFQVGALRTGDDGHYTTPSNLMAGSTYRVAVRAPDREPVFSNWVTIQPGMDLKALLPLRSRPLRSVQGRVVDRQGAPVANVEMFQAGDGPKRTSSRTGADGRFTLGGFRQGPVFLFARGDGFRFHGQLIKQERGDVSIDITLTRHDEKPERAMRMLSDPVPLEESRALAHRLIEPVWQAVSKDGSGFIKFRVLSAMVPANPTGTIETLGEAGLPENLGARIRSGAAVALADKDPEAAVTVAWTIVDPYARLMALFDVVQELTDAQRPRALALLARVAGERKTVRDPGQQLFVLGRLGEQLYRLGEARKAKTFIDEGLAIASRMSAKQDPQRAAFAVPLALLDARAAWSILQDFHDHRMEGTFLLMMANSLAEHDPTGAERAWKRAERLPHGAALNQQFLWKFAEADPERAWRLTSESKSLDARPDSFIFLAYGMRKRDPSGARRALDEATRRIDRALQELPQSYERIAGTFLPFVEAVDPERVPEFFWRALASRPPVGNPRRPDPQDSVTTSYLIQSIAWYDREVAATLFEPVRERMRHVKAQELATWRAEFLAWSLFDPRAAAARLETVPVGKGPGDLTDDARIETAGSLGLPHDDRWMNLRDWRLLFKVKRRMF